MTLFKLRRVILGLHNKRPVQASISAHAAWYRLQPQAPVTPVRSLPVLSRATQKQNVFLLG